MNMISLAHGSLLLLFFQFIFVILITIFALQLLKSSKGGAALNEPPGSRGLPLVGETLAFIRANDGSKGFYDFVQKRHARYGNCFKTNILGKTHVFISSTEAAKTLVGSESPDFSMYFMKSIVEVLGDQSILCASHEHHKLIRRKISSLFTFDSFLSTIREFDQVTVMALATWKQDESVSVFDEALKITFRAICKMLISLEEGNEAEMLRKDVFDVTEAMLAIPVKFPGTRFYKGIKARRRIMRTLERKLVSRRKGLDCHDDFLQAFVRSESESDSVILDNIVTLIIAGQITTASTMAWMVKYLDENQEVQARLRGLQMQLALSKCSSNLGLDALNDMSYASKIVKESLRMATIVAWFPRVALRDCQLGGFHIRKGWIVNVDARGLHYDPSLYDKPLEFNPSRFDEDPKPYTFLAFGAGGRTCLGMNLAKAMLLIFLHRLVTTYRWKVTDPDPSLERWEMFPRLRSGCPISISPVSDIDSY